MCTAVGLVAVAVGTLRDRPRYERGAHCRRSYVWVRGRPVAYGRTERGIVRGHPHGQHGSPAYDSAEKSAFGTRLHRWHQGEVAAEQGHVAPHIETAGHVTLPKEKHQIRRRA